MVKFSQLTMLANRFIQNPRVCHWIAVQNNNAISFCSHLVPRALPYNDLDIITCTGKYNSVYCDASDISTI